MSPRRMASNRVGVGGTAVLSAEERRDVNACNREAEAAMMASEEEGPPSAPAPYQPPAEESVPAVEPVALGAGGDVVPVPVSPESLHERAGSPGADLDAEFPGHFSPEPVASAVAGEPEPPESLTDLAANVRRLREKLAVQDENMSDTERLLRGLMEVTAETAKEEAAAVDALAKRLPKGGVVVMSDGIFRAVPPRKPRGKPVDPSALWTLERVEVAK